VIKAEAGSILKACLMKTKIATEKQVTLRERATILMDIGGGRAPGGERYSINIGKKGAFGAVWRVIPAANGGQRGIQQTHKAGFKAMNRHYKSKTWDALTAYIERFRTDEKRRVPLAKKSIGLTAQSWLQIADSAGIDITKVGGGGTLPAKKMKAAREAMGSNGQAYRNGYVQEKGTGRKYELTLFNVIPWGNAVGLDRMLSIAVMNRVKFYERNVANGCFDTIEKTLKAYPNIKLQRKG
jgi:hypothetical protein